MSSPPDANDARLRRAIEHTLLRSEATAAEVEVLCAEARSHGVLAVCVNPVHVARAASQLAGSGVRVVGVVAFPLGATLSAAKARECELVVAAGADEVDMVQDVGAAVTGDWAHVTQDIRAVVAAAAGRAVKVILETAKLDDAQKRRACAAAEAAGAAFVKTCTGFGGGGATTHDVALMREAVGTRMGVKASGGVRSRAQALALLDAGADRIGTSAGPALLGA